VVVEAASAHRVEDRPAPAAWVLLGVGVTAASVAAILIRFASPEGADPLALSFWRSSSRVHPLAVSFWRCAGGAAALAVVAGPRLRGIRIRSLAAPAAAGSFLAIHFAAWITSLGLTTVAASVLLVSTTPVFVAVADYVLFRARLVAVVWAGIGLTLAGSALVAGGDFSASLEGSAPAGNALAVVGAVTAAGYFMTGRAARRTLDVREYALVTYAVAAMLLLVSCVATGIPLTGYSSTAWWAVAGLIAGPQLLGHTVINFVLKDIDATTVSVAVMAEPVIATALAFAVFDEVPPALAYPGGLAILLGIYLVSSSRRTPAAAPQ
jgi:drug/metabolite transporter (DMT)-like permease